jgi:hypothetical protein
VAFKSERRIISLYADGIRNCCDIIRQNLVSIPLLSLSGICTSLG